MADNYISKLFSSESKSKSASEAKDVSLWQERVTIARKELDDWAERSGANKFVNEYKGKYGIVFHTRKGSVPVPPINEVFSYVQSDVATTFNRDPYITVNPKAGTVRGAKLWEVQLNYYWRELGVKEELEFEIIDKDLIGYGWHKVGWAVDSVGDNEQLKIVKENLYSMRLDWKDVVWNINARRPPKDCLWMAQRIVMPLEEVKRRYPAAKGLGGTPHPDVNKESYTSASYKDDIKVQVIYEIWDAQKRQVLLIADGLKDIYLSPPKPWPDYLDEFPFQMYWDFVCPGSSRPMSAIAPWEDQILMEMVILGRATQHTASWARQLFVRGGSIDENALDKYERGDDGAVITVNSSMEDGSFKFSDFGQLPQDFYLLMDRLQAIKRNINGQPEFMRGGVTKTGTRTVGELQKMEIGFQGRQNRKIDRLETHIENISRHMMFHLKANMDLEKTVKISGQVPDEVLDILRESGNLDEQNMTITFTPEDIQGEYDVEVKAGSTLPLSKENRTQILETVLNTVASAVPAGGVSPFMATLIIQILEDYDIKGLKEAFLVEQKRMEEEKQGKAQQAQVQDQKAMADADKRQAQADKIKADTVITGQEAALGPMGRAEMEVAVKESGGM